jgi:hypothetical protein
MADTGSGFEDRPDVDFQFNKDLREEDEASRA